MAHAEATTRGHKAERVLAFEYPAGDDEPEQASWINWGAEEAPAPKLPEAHPVEHGPSAHEVNLRAEFEQRLAEERRKALEAGREQGRQEGRQNEREAHLAMQTAAEQDHTRQLTMLLAKFTEERDRYLKEVEHEVVKLALAVAARILRREAQMDPLLLTGAVRVALGQLAGTTQVRLRVPASEIELWTEAIALLPNLAVKPVVSVGEGMRLGDCEIESELGSVDLGIRAQLGEIERGFFDRAARARAATTEPVIRTSEQERTV